MDLCHLDEAGFALTLPTGYTWYPQGARLRVPYQAPQGRRVNAIGAYFAHGPQAGRLDFQSWAVLPQSRAKTPRTTPQERAAAQGLSVDEVGPIDAQRLVAFLWQIAGRPADASADWKRGRPLVVALDNYSVHTGVTVPQARPLLAAANVHLLYLARYCPEQSEIEPIWNDVKQHHLPIRSFEQVADLKRAVDTALARKAQQLQQAHAKTSNLHRPAAWYPRLVACASTSSSTGSSNPTAERVMAARLPSAGNQRLHPLTVRRPRRIAAATFPPGTYPRLSLAAWASAAAASSSKPAMPGPMRL